MYRRPQGENADGAPTVRNILPWRDMEKKLAMRLAEKAAAGELEGFDQNVSRDALGNEIERAPDSGVRPSGNGPADTIDPALPLEPVDPNAPLSFAVYTVADLDKKTPSRPPRMSLAFAPTYTPPSYFHDLGIATQTLFTTLYSVIRAHVHTQKPRPRLRIAMQPPIAAWRAELKKTLATLPWKRVAIGFGIAFASLLVLLFIVLTAAELTDDLKPAATGTTSVTLVEKSKMDAKDAKDLKDAKDKSAAETAAAAAAATSEPEPTIEIDDQAAAPAPKPKKHKSAKKKAPEMFVP